MNTKITIVSVLVAVVVIGILFLVFRSNASPASPQAPAVTKPPIPIASQSGSTSLTKAPDFSLQNYNGKTVKLNDFAGKPLVINSWAAWCPFCRKELADFAAAQKEFSNRVIIIGVDRAETLVVTKKYTDELGATNNLLFLLDPADSFYQSIGGFSMPETIFVDGNGNVKIHKRGPMDIDEMREKIQKLLQD